MSLDIKDLDILKIRNSFPYWSSLLYGLLLIIIIIVSVDDFLTKYIINENYRILGYTILVLGWYIFWHLGRLFVKKNQKNKIGIVICIKTENEKQKIRLKNDFVKRLRELIHTHKLNDMINIVEQNEFHTERIYKILYDYSRLKESDKDVKSRNPIYKKWKKVMENSRGHFFLWGDIKERTDIENKYFFDLDGMVIHAPIQSDTPNPLEKAFRNVWIKKVMFKESHEAVGFQITADLLMIPVAYVIGIAAFISGEPFIALKIHEGLIQDFNNFDPLPPNLEKVKYELKTYLSDENQVLARNCQLLNNSIEAWKYLRKALEYDSSNYEGWLLESLFYFEIDNNPEKAIRSCYQAKDFAKGSRTWKYNLAFLLMYLERFKEALKWYEDIIEDTFEGEDFVLDQIIQFNENLLIWNPNHIQSYFIIGYLKYYKKNNSPEALENFEKLVSKTQGNNKYNLLVKIAEKLIKEINYNLGLQEKDSH